MSVRKLAAGILSLLVTCGMATTSHAQGNLPVDPFAFDPDFRWFEPVYDVDLDELKPEKRAPSGWFATYDRLNLYGTRPESQIISGSFGSNSDFDSLDSGWGHRYEVGYMLPHEDHGFTFTYMSNDVGEFLFDRNLVSGQVIAEGDDDPTLDDDPTNDINVSDLFSLDEFIDELTSINAFSFDSYELNKTWRLTPYHYGGILEPMVGLRYMRLRDRAIYQDYTPAFDPITGTANTNANGDVNDSLISSEGDTDNDMIGGQIGFRYFKTRMRFTHSLDFRVFAGGNYQSSRFRRTNTVRNFAGGGLPGADTLPQQEFTQTEVVRFARNEEFFVGFDLRGELGYQLTRMIQVRGGFQLLDIGTGVWRGGFSDSRITGDQNQDLLMLGGTFGISLNH
ncbi:MAG: BBP7 family outer membrane beta-barrel protein [Planctomycetota bacterium]